MDELHRKGIAQTLLCAKGSVMENWAYENSFPYYTFKKNISVNPLNSLRLAQLAAKLQCTHVHTHDSHGHTSAVIAASFLGMKTPLIVHRRVDFPIKKTFIAKWKYNHSLIRAIICTSEFIRQLILPDILKKEVVHTIHSGIDLSTKKLNNLTQIRTEFGIPSHDKVIINLAAIAPHKDYYTFVDTAEYLIKKGLNVTFLLIGEDGGEKAIIEKYISQKGLTEKLIFTGFRKDIPEILSQSDLMLFTSKTEGLGGATLDALKSGVPVVSTAVGGVPEIIEDGKTGLLAPIGNSKILAEKVLLLLEKTALKKELIQNGLEKINDFSKAKTAEETLEIYLNTIALD